MGISGDVVRISCSFMGVYGGSWDFMVDLMGFNGIHSLVNVYISMENHYVQWKNPLSMAIFHSYADLPGDVF